MVIPATEVRFGGWTVGPVIGRRPAGVAREAVQPSTGAHAVLVVVDARFTDRMPPDAAAVGRAGRLDAAALVPLLDAGLLDDGTRWYVAPAAPGPVLDPAAGCSPRRAAAIVEAVARALAAVHAAGLVHGLVGPQSVVPAAGRHAERPVPATLLLDTGVAALLGDRAADLAAASGVVLPRDRGPAADVHALGGLLLRLLTAAAPAGPALAALPVPLRALLSEMLEDDPAARPAAAAVAARLGALRDGLLATGPVDLPTTGAQRVPEAAARATAPVPVVPSVPPTASPTREIALPTPVRAPVTLDAPIDAPDPLPAAAPSLRTGPVAIRSDGRPARRRGRIALLAAGGVGLAGLLVGVLTHLPTGQEAGAEAVVAAAKDGVGARPASSTATGTASTAADQPRRTPAAAPTGRARHRAAAPAAAAPAPAFVRPVVLVPSPLAASATSPTPSRSTATPPRASTAPSRPASSAPSSSAPAGGGSSAPAPSAPTSSAPASSAPPAQTAPPSSAPVETPPAATPTPSATEDPTPTPTDTALAESTDPIETLLPSGPAAG